MDNFYLWRKAASLRKQLGVDLQSPIDIFPLVYAIDRLTVVYYPMGDRLSGICIKGQKSNVIAINSAMSVGRQRFSMAHELFHLFYDANLATSVCSKNIGSGCQTEKDADRFASYFLMPPDTLTDVILKIKKKADDKLTVNDIVRLEQYFGVSRQAILIRIIEENELTFQEADSMRHNIIITAGCLGYDDTLYKPSSPEKQYMTYGYYIQQSDEIFKKELISSGKYEELLLDAFRSDLVYGDAAEGGELGD